MSQAFIFLVLFLPSFLLMAEDDQSIKDKILKQYGDRGQYESVVQSQQEEKIRIKIKTYQRRLREPLIKNPESYKQLNIVEKENYLQRRRQENEVMSRYILKHHKLLEREEQQKYLAQKKKEELLAERKKDSKPTASDIKNFDQLIENISKDSSELEGVEINDSFLTSFMNENTKKAAMDLMKTNPFSAMSKGELESMILARTEGSPLNSLFKKNPKALVILVEVLQDKKAVPAMMSIINKPEQMKKYGFACIFIILIGFFINIKNSKAHFMKRVLYKIILSFSTIGCNLAVFYYLFYQEISPTVQIIKKVYFN
jgi:hypothetical protein